MGRQVGEKLGTRALILALVRAVLPVALLAAFSTPARAESTRTPFDRTEAGLQSGGERGGTQGGDSLPLIGQPAAAQAGFDGAGQTIAMLDTGVDFTRPEFGSCPRPGKG
jgi:hypothetical protein